jgi:hypothetical protein
LFRPIASGLVSILALAMGSCVSEGPEPRPEPVRTIHQPEGLVVDKVVLGVENPPDDTDRNGYFDTYRVIITLYDDIRYRGSVYMPGSFRVRIRAQDNHDIAVWEISAEQAARAWGMSGALPAYVFRLNMRDVGTDKVDLTEALIGCSFTPTGGSTVESGSWLTVRVGRTR